MPAILVSDSGGNTELRAAVGGGDNTIYLPNRSGKAAMDGPCFSAYLGTSQSVSASTWTKLQINTEEFDTNSNYDNVTNYRFTPTVAGYYNIICGVAAFDGANTSIAASIYKNGVAAKTAWNTATTAGALDDVGITFSALLYINGSSDYVELYARLTGTGLVINSGAANTYFQASFIRGA